MGVQARVLFWTEKGPGNASSASQDSQEMLKKLVTAVKNTVKDKDEQNKRIIDIYQRQLEQLEHAAKLLLERTVSPDMVVSGARGRPSSSVR